MIQEKESLLMKYTNKYKEVLHSFIFENIKGRVPCYILDIGCKVGEDLKRISLIRSDKRLCGIDISFESLDIALRKLKEFKNIYLFQAKGQNLPFKKDSFDIVTSSEVIEHMEIKEAEKLIDDVYRVLKPRGIFILTTPSRYNYSTLIGKLMPRGPFKNFLRRKVYYLNPGPENVNPHIHEYTPREMKKLIEKHGFAIEHIVGGTLRVPIWPLFDKISFLLLIWKCLDRLLDIFPFGMYFKLHYVIEAKKT